MSEATENRLQPLDRIEEFDRFDFLVFEEGRNHAIVRQWPNLRDEVWHFDYPPKWIGSILGAIEEEGWEPVSVTIHTRGWLWWRREVRTWLFQKRIPCRKVFSGSGVGSMTSRLLEGQEMVEHYDSW